MLFVVYVVANLKINCNLRIVLLGMYFSKLCYVIGISFGQTNMFIFIYVKQY